MNIQDAQTLDLLNELERRGHYCSVVSKGDVDLICEEQNLDLTTDDKNRILSQWKDFGETMGMIDLEFQMKRFKEMLT